MAYVLVVSMHWGWYLKTDIKLIHSCRGQVTGWAGLIRVDGKTYTWLGQPSVNGQFPPSVTQIAFEYTSTRSSFTMNVAGKVSMNVTFLSPITPTDIMRQSLVAMFLSVDVQAIDGNTHSVQLYADTSAGMSSSGQYCSLLIILARMGCRRSCSVRHLELWCV